jgi:hypothetical protein
LEIKEAKVQQNLTHLRRMSSENEDKSNSKRGIKKENGEHKRDADGVEFVDEGSHPSSLEDDGASFDEALLIKACDDAENTTNPTSASSKVSPPHGFTKALPNWRGDAHRFSSFALSRLVRDTTMASAATGQDCKVPRAYSIEEILSRALEIVNDIDVSSMKTS